MNFHTLSYFVFLAFAAVFYSLVKKEKRAILILTFSLLFLGFNSLLSVVLALGLSSSNFIFLQLMHKRSEKDLFFKLGIIFNCTALLAFNYLFFFHEQGKASTNEISFMLSDHITFIGISFYTIQHILTLFEYKRECKPFVYSFSDFLSSSLFFPKIIAGPIQSNTSIIEQILQKKQSKSIIVSGINRFSIGLFKKIVIADRLSLYVHSLFDFGERHTVILLLVSGLLFTIQLYFDFSGYCDMAIGSARMFGIELKENFNMPLRSVSVTEFWRKWHITLMDFFKNTIFLPIAYHFRNKKELGITLAIAATFLISGIWHGIGTGFFIWAILHFVYIVSEHFLLKTRHKSSSKSLYFLKWMCTLVLISFSNIFFRSKNGESTLQYVRDLFQNNFFPDSWLKDFWAKISSGGMQADYFNLAISIILLTIFLLFENKINRKSNETTFSIFYFGSIIGLVLLFGVFDKGERFIYMQF